jgi:hypothetical protein
MKKHFDFRYGAFSRTSIFKKLFFIILLIHLTGCGFQGRKYTSGHFWESGTKNEYEKRNGNEELKENGNEELKPEKKEKESAISQRIASEEKFFSKIDEINSAFEIIEEQKFIAPPSRSQTNHMLSNTRDESPSTIEIPDEIERETVPLALINKHKTINRQIIWGLVISSFSFDIFGAVLGLGIHEPDLIFIPIIALCILPFFLVPHLKKLKLSIEKFKQELESYKSTNAEKKWFKREKSYLENIDLLHGAMIALSISFLLLSLLMIYAVFAGG